MNLNRAARRLARKLFARDVIGLILYIGPSEIDGEMIVVIATGFGSPSTNRKVGDMINIWILRLDVDPVTAARNGDDVSICGDCRHRYDPVTGQRTCYVIPFQAPRSVYAAYQRGRYHLATPGIGTRHRGRHRAITSAELTQVFSGALVRFGAYGDPGAVPAHVWAPIVAVMAPGSAGYTHRWQDIDVAQYGHLMASVDSEAEYLDATAQGWRTFRVRRTGEPLLARERACPADSHGLQCTACKQCDGIVNGARRPNRAVLVHGAQASRF